MGTVMGFVFKDEVAAVVAFLIAAAIVVAVTPTIANIARRMGVMD